MPTLNPVGSPPALDLLLVGRALGLLLIGWTLGLGRRRPRLGGRLLLGHLLGTHLNLRRRQLLKKHLLKPNLQPKIMSRSKAQ